MGNSLSYTTAEHVVDLGPKGKIKGLRFDDKAIRYAGVPYALPPTGAHRWRKPRPLPPSYSYAADDGSGPYVATAFSPPCHQEERVIGNVVRHADNSGRTSEDCLVLNIWTPVATDGQQDNHKKWPVMLWIHGGWFQIGQPSQRPSEDVTELLSTGNLNAVYVSIGYRLNVFGFLATEHLADEAVDSAAGNFGLWDQRLAIEWVHENIHYFGGDANNVTLAGQSAGSYAVEAQVLYDFRSPAAEATRKPFHRIFMSSNAIPAQPKVVADAEAQFEELCSHLGISPNLSGKEKLDKLRAVDGQALVDTIAHLKHHTFRPVTDDVFIHSGMLDYLRDGRFATEFQKRGMKLLIGEVLNEETLYAQFSSPDEPTFDALRLQTSNYYALSTTDRILERYTLPNSADTTAWKTAFGNIIADGQVRASSRRFIQDLYSNGIPLTHIWRYRVDYRCSWIDESLAPKSFGVAHSMDGPMWNFSLVKDQSPAEQEFLANWVGCLGAFVGNSDAYDYGTKSIDEVRVAKANGTIGIETDTRFQELVELGDIFAGR